MDFEIIKRPWLKHYDPGVPYHLEYPAITAFDLLEEARQQFPDQTCIICENISLTYAQADEFSKRLAAGLRALGVQKGDRVGLLLPNIPQFILAYFAVLRTGAIVVAINPMYNAREISSQVKDAGVTGMIVIRDSLANVEQAVLGTSVRWVVLTDLREDFHKADSIFKREPLQISELKKQAQVQKNASILLNFFDLLLSDPMESPGQFEVSPEDEALFQFSGGTTGVPKAAVALHRNLVANTIQFRHWLVGAQEGQETMLLAIPLYHVYGMVVGMLVAVRLAARMVLITNPRDLQNLLKTIQTYRATLFPGVPNLYNAIVNDPLVQAGEYDLSTIKACISGSAPLLRETKEKFEALTGGKLMEGYGLSEAPTATHCNPMIGENRTGSIGLPLPDVDCRIVSLEDGKTPLPPGEAGELILVGPQVMKGYYNMPEETALTLVDGWLYTGDIARMDADGYFYLVDRKKDVIKPGGFQVWPREVEEILVKHPKVLEAAVSGVVDPIRGEVVKAWVVLRPEFRPGNFSAPEQAAEIYRLTEDELRDFCRRELAPFKVPSIFEFRTELPRTAVGKVLRRELVRQHYEKIPPPS